MGFSTEQIHLPSKMKRHITDSVQLSRFENIFIITWKTVFHSKRENHTAHAENETYIGANIEKPPWRDNNMVEQLLE